MMTRWTPESWRTRTALHIPADYPDARALEAVGDGRQQRAPSPRRVLPQSTARLERVPQGLLRLRVVRLPDGADEPSIRR
jgi:hypothetical protein